MENRMLESDRVPKLRARETDRSNATKLGSIVSNRKCSFLKFIQFEIGGISVINQLGGVTFPFRFTLAWATIHISRLPWLRFERGVTHI